VLVHGTVALLVDDVVVVVVFDFDGTGPLIVPRGLVVVGHVAIPPNP
jgi:hypothetical protein